MLVLRKRDRVLLSLPDLVEKARSGIEKVNNLTIHNVNKDAIISR